MIRRTFLRRTYSRPGELAADLRSLRRTGAAARSGPRSAVAADFRERLMLVVTEVNGCRYCSWFHSGSALTAGIPLPELGELLRGRLPQDGKEHPLRVEVAAAGLYWFEFNDQAAAWSIRVAAGRPVAVALSRKCGRPD